MIDWTDDGTNGKGYDFGDGGDVSPESDAHFDAWVVKAAPELNVPPATPRLEMWKAILAKQQVSRDAQRRAIHGVLPLRTRRWMVPAAIAAALLAGVALDRLAVVRRTVTAPTTISRVTAPVAPPSADTNTSSRLYRLAAVQTLTQAEALLTAYRASDVAVRNPQAARQLGTWGREVLSSTRLLLDSPAGDDPHLRSLLNDLELVLVQVIRSSGTPLEASDRALIDRALREHDLLPRIRTAVPAGVAGTASDE